MSDQKLTISEWLDRLAHGVTEHKTCCNSMGHVACKQCPFYTFNINGRFTGECDSSDPLERSNELYEKYKWLRKLELL